MSESAVPNAKTAARRLAGDWRSIPPSEAPPPPDAETLDGIAGLPSIDIIANDPAAHAAALERLRRIEARGRFPVVRVALALAGVVALFTGVVVANRLYTSWRAAPADVANMPFPAAPPNPAAPPGAPRPVTTAPVRVGPETPADQKPLMTTEWLRAHEALGLPPPKPVRTIRIVPPRAE